MEIVCGGRLYQRRTSRTTRMNTVLTALPPLNPGDFVPFKEGIDLEEAERASDSDMCGPISLVMIFLRQCGGIRNAS